MKKLSPKIHPEYILGGYPEAMSTFWKRLRIYLRRTRPALVGKLALAVLLLAPFWLPALLLSLRKTARWKQPAKCRELLRRYRRAFPLIDPRSVRVQMVPGGVSNAGFVWRCKTLAGQETSYFVKVFLPVGTLWAKILPILSPFPKIEAVSVQQRMAADLFARMQLEKHGVAVPACVAVDPAEGVAVGEYLKGRMVSDLLADVRRAGRLAADDRYLLWECGNGLRQIHQAGFSLIDAQPANCMWVPDRQKVYFLDMEYSTRRDERDWDLRLFLAFVRAQLTGPLQEEVRRAILQGYWGRRYLLEAPPAEDPRALDDFRGVFQTILDLRRLTPEQMFG